MDGAWVAAGHFAAAALMLLLASVLLWLNSASPPVRAFVAFLVLRAGASVARPLARIMDPVDPVTVAALASWIVYLQITAAGCVFWLLATFPRPAPRVVSFAVLALTMMADAIFFFDECQILCGAERGRLYFLLQALPLAVSVAAIVYLLAALRMLDGPRRDSTRIVGVAFAFEAALWAGTALPSLGSGPAGWPLIAGLGVVCVAVVALSGRARIVVPIALTAAGVCAYLGNRAPLFMPASIGFLLLGLWRMTLPALAAYALLRHRLFDLDVRVKLVLQRATIGAVFAGVFFVVTEGSAYVLGSQFGMLAGIVAVGALVPAMGPLRRAAERIAELLPEASAPARELPLERRRQIYHEFALQAWADGALAREERAFLDQIRVRLGLSAEDALRLESEASQATRGG